MACYRPLTAWKIEGQAKLVFAAPKGSSDPSSIHRELQLPCGRCVGCLLERSRQWAVRCMHEASMHEDNCFLTLTYDDDNVPLSLKYRDYQLFMKRLRKSLDGQAVRFFMCGEYGEQFGRPHFHALLFGYRPVDCVVVSERDSGRLYTSRRIDSLWGKGFATIGDVTFDSAAYVARYVMKKLDPDAVRSVKVDWSTGGEIEVDEEFCHMSTKPAIGLAWIKKFREDVYPRDEVIMRGHKMKPPRYYDKYLESFDEWLYEDLKVDRLEKSLEVDSLESSRERLEVRERVARASITSKRSL